MTRVLFDLNADVRKTRKKKKKRVVIPYELRHQANVVQTLYYEHREAWEHLFSIPNGGSRHGLEAENLKEQGQKNGVPDLFIALPRGKFHGLFIEMKRLPTEGKGKIVISESQWEWHHRLKAAGYATYFCYGYDEAMRTIKAYLRLM